MEQETNVKLRNYAICVGVELLLVFLVIWIKDFFTDSAAVNLQILADAFFVAGIMMTLFSGLMLISSEGAFVGVSYVLRFAVLAFVPMGRTKWERYADYRERKLGKIKNRNRSCVLITGLVFLFIGIALTGIWYVKYYNVV